MASVAALGSVHEAETVMLKRIALALLLLGTMLGAGTVSLAPTTARAEPPDHC
jgi:hypothetical protein